MGGVVRKILCRQGHLTIVDDEDFERYSTLNWSTTTHLYVHRREGDKTVYLHRLIVGALSGQHVDHKNHDTLDNRRENLRICTVSQNHANRRSRPGQFKGIYKKRQGWCALLGTKPKQVVLGTYETAEEAAAAYDHAARSVWGEFACTNFPELLPEPLTLRQKAILQASPCPICGAGVVVNPIGIVRIFCSHRCKNAASRSRRCV
jgi:hypothetical protein